jgi:hypothetical protein
MSFRRYPASPTAGGATEATLLAILADTDQIVVSTNNISQAVGTTASPLPGHTMTIGGANADGNLYTLDVDTSGRLILDQSSSTIQNYTHDANGVAILSSLDIIGGSKSGLDVNLLSGGVIGNIYNNLAFPYQNSAVSVGFLNGGLLVPPAMDTVTNQLIVDVTQSGTVPVNVIGFTATVSTSLDYVSGSNIGPSNSVPSSLYNPTTGTKLTTGVGAPDGNTLRVSAMLVTPSAALYDFDAGITTSNTQRVVISNDQSKLSVTQADTTATGVITFTQSVQIVTNGAGTVGAQISGTWTGTITVEGSIDGTNWLGTVGVALTSGAASANFSANNIIQINCSGLGFIRLRGNSVATGSATIRLVANQSVGNVMIDNAIPSGTNTIGSINNISGTVSLPTGASTSALQTSGNAILTSIDASNVSMNNKTPALGQALAAASVPVVLTAAQITTLTPPTTVFAKLQDGSGNSINSTSNALNVNISSGSVTATNPSVSATGSAAPASATLIGGSDGTNLRGVKVSSTGVVSVDGSAVTQPISAVSLPLPTGAASETTLSAINLKTPSLGTNVIANSSPVNIASDQVVNVSNPDLYITGQAAQTAVINNIIPATAGATGTDAANYKSGTIQIISTATGGSYILETSNDNVNFVPLLSYNIALNTGIAVNGAVTPTASTIAYSFSVQARYIRVRIATLITGGNIQAFTRLSQAAWTPAVTSVAQATGANLNTVLTSGTLTTLTTLTGITNTVTTKQTSVKGQFIRNDYTVTPVTTGAYVQLIASTGFAYSAVEIFDSSGQTLVLAIGAAASEVDQFIIFPGGNGRIPFTLAVSQRISIKALSGTANVGEIDINFYQ